MQSFNRPARIFTAAVAVAAVAVVAGCSAGSPQEGDAVDLSLMIWDPAQAGGVQLAVDAFEEAHPDITVTLEQVPHDQYYTKLDASLSAGEGPDVMWQSSRAQDYVDGGALQPLDEYIARDALAMDAYAEQITGLYTFDGEQYGIPKDQDAWTFVINTAVFSELGVEPPAADWTWEDMLRIADEVRAEDPSGGIVPLHYNYTFNNGVASLVHALGGRVLDGAEGSISSPHGEQALAMVKDLQDRGAIPRVADSADFDAVTSLISGDLAMAEIPSWNLSLLSQADVPEGTFEVVRLPSVDGSWASDTNGLSYVMNANSSQKDAAWELIAFLTSEEGAVLHAEGGAGLPANRSDAALAAFVEANSALVGLEEALDAAREHAYLRTSSEYPATRSVMSEIDSTAMGPFYDGKLSASEAAARIDEILGASLR